MSRLVLEPVNRNERGHQTRLLVMILHTSVGASLVPRRLTPCRPGAAERSGRSDTRGRRLDLTTERRLDCHRPSVER